MLESKETVMYRSYYLKVWCHFTNVSYNMATAGLELKTYSSYASILKNRLNPLHFILFLKVKHFPLNTHISFSQQPPQHY